MRPPIKTSHDYEEEYYTNISSCVYDILLNNRK